jgi:iron(III) transport system substrate-binding protein
MLIVAAVAAASLAAGCGADSADDGRQVVVYTSVDQEIAEPVLAEFERSSGVRVLARYDTEAGKTVGLVQRLRAEAVRPAADVFWSGEVFHTVRLAQEGLLEPYRSDATRDWPAGLADPDGRWYGFALRARVVAWHTGRVRPEDAPSRLEDLLDEKWRGRIVMASPEFGTTSGHVASWFAYYGPERATQILERLKANQVRLVAGNSTAVRVVAGGEADVCITDTDDVYAAQRNGWPVAMRLLRHGDGGPLVIPNTASVVRGGPHPEAARLLMAFLLSEEVERLLARSDSHNTPVHPAVAAEFPQYAISGRLPVGYEKVAESIPRAVGAAVKALK